MAGHGVRARGLTSGRGQRARAAARRLRAGAGPGPGGRPERDPRRRRGTPRPQARERTAGRRRAPGHRLRHLPGRRGQRAHPHRTGGGIPRVHVTGTSRRPAGRAAQRHLQPGRGAGVRRHRPGTVRHRIDPRAGLPRGLQPAEPGPAPSRGPAADRALPGQRSRPAAHRRATAGRRSGGLPRDRLAARAGDPHVHPGSGGARCPALCPAHCDRGGIAPARRGDPPSARARPVRPASAASRLAAAGRDVDSRGAAGRVYLHWRRADRQLGASCWHAVRAADHVCDHLNAHTFGICSHILAGDRHTEYVRANDRANDPRRQLRRQP